MNKLYIPFIFVLLFIYIAILEFRNSNNRDARLASWLAVMMGAAGLAAIWIVGLLGGAPET